MTHSSPRAETPPEGAREEFGRSYGGRSPEDRRRERRQRLAEAGLQLFGAEGGYLATSVKAVCDRAGVSPRHFYEQFEDREALLVHLLQELGRELMQASYEAAAGLTDIEAAVRAGVRAYLQVLADDRRKARLLFRESVGVGNAVEQVRNAIRDGFAEIVRERALALGAVREETPENDLLPVGVVGAVHEMANQAFLRPEGPDLDALTDQCCLVYMAIATHLTS